jgi:vacuolar-type H+-ATPase subunit H
MDYLKSIAEAEQEAAHIVEQAKNTTAKAIESANINNAKRKADTKETLKVKAQSELSTQKKSLAKLYSSLTEEGSKEAQALKTAALGKRDRAVAKLISLLASE